MKSEFESFQWKLSKRKTFCKKKSFSSLLLMLLPSVSPIGGIGITKADAHTFKEKPEAPKPIPTL